jgi:hypothetical protein
LKVDCERKGKMWDVNSAYTKTTSPKKE